MKINNVKKIILITLLNPQHLHGYLLILFPSSSSSSYPTSRAFYGKN